MIDLQAMRTSKIHLLSFVAGIALIVLLTKLTHFLPAEYYFSFAGFLYVQDVADPAVGGQLHWMSLVIKLATPLLVGLILGALWTDDGIASAGPAGFAGALLLCWPGLVEWELVASPDVVARRNQFLLLYALYIGSFAYLCAAGARLGPGLRSWFARRVDVAGTGKVAVDWNKLVNELVKSAVLGGISLVVGYVIK